MFYINRLISLIEVIILLYRIYLTIFMKRSTTTKIELNTFLLKRLGGSLVMKSIEISS